MAQRFIAGATKEYASNDLANMRVVPLLLTADMKAHAEVGLVSSKGYKGCRHCEAKAEYFCKYCRYGNFQKRYRNPAALRNAETNRIHGRAADNASTVSERRSILTKTGVTGESIIYRLYDLCGFHPVRDQVIDIMHCLCLNLTKNELDHKMLKSISNNASLQPSERDPQAGGVISRNSLAEGHFRESIGQQS